MGENKDDREVLSGLLRLTVLSKTGLDSSVEVFVCLFFVFGK